MARSTRNQARRTAGLSNLKQLDVAVVMYSSDFYFYPTLNHKISSADYNFSHWKTGPAPQVSVTLETAVVPNDPAPAQGAFLCTA